MPAEQPVQGSVRLSRDGVDVTVHLPFAQVAKDPAVHPPAVLDLPAGGERTHTADFGSVLWDGAHYTFSHKQRLVIAALWKARDDGHHFLTQEELLEQADSDGCRLRDLFRRHPAWGTMIVAGVVSGGSLGTYRLAP